MIELIFDFLKLKKPFFVENNNISYENIGGWLISISNTLVYVCDAPCSVSRFDLQDPESLSKIKETFIKYVNFHGYH